MACGGAETPPAEGHLSGAEGAEIHYRVIGSGRDTVVVVHGATGPRRAEAARLAREAPPSPDTALSRRMNEALGSLLRGNAEDPVEACERYEELGRRLAEADAGDR